MFIPSAADTFLRLGCSSVLLVTFSAGVFKVCFYYTVSGSAFDFGFAVLTGVSTMVGFCRFILAHFTIITGIASIFLVNIVGAA
jgi:hypothetical protein